MMRIFKCLPKCSFAFKKLPSFVLINVLFLFLPNNSRAQAIFSASSTISFGNVTVGTTSERTLIITNNGNSVLTINSVNGLLYDFMVGVWYSDIPAGGFDSITTYFMPSSAGFGSENLIIQTNVGTYTIVCSGTGVPAVIQGPVINISGNLNFGTVDVGSSNSSLISISNSGNQDLEITGMGSTNGFSVNFNSITYISPGDYQTFQVNFTPSMATSYFGNISVTSNAVSGNGSVSCYGNGTNAPSAPLPPSGLVATAISSSTIDLSWDAESNATSYFVYTCDGNYLATTSTNSYADNSLNANTYRSYAIAANNNVGCSAFSDCQGATTSNNNVIPCIPIDNDYPYPYGDINNPPPFDCNSSSQYEVDQWNFWAYTCTSWVAWKINQEFGVTSSPYVFTDDAVLGHTIQGGIGIAGSWEGALTGINGLQIEEDNNPAVGAIAWYEYGAPGGFVDGHVAFVNCVNSTNGDVDLTEYNAQKIDGATVPFCVYGHRTININRGNVIGNRLPTSYLHIEKLITNQGAVNKNSISIYPNPSKDQINVSINGVIGNGTLNVFNSMGILVYRNQLFNSNMALIDLTNFIDGIYNIQVIGSGQTMIKQFQVQK